MKTSSSIFGHVTLVAPIGSYVAQRGLQSCVWLEYPRIKEPVMSMAKREAKVIDLIEIERRAINETFASLGRDWFWDADTHGSLRRVGDVKKQLDEYGCRTGELLSYEQIVQLHDEVTRRLGALVLSRGSEQPDQAWVA